MSKAWVSEAMDLYARAMLMFDKRDRQMHWARQDKTYSGDRRRTMDTVKLARMCHKTGMRLMSAAKGARSYET